MKTGFEEELQKVHDYHEEWASLKDYKDTQVLWESFTLAQTIHEFLIKEKLRIEVIQGLLTVGNLALRGIPLEHAERCIYLLRNDIEELEKKGIL